MYYPFFAHLESILQDIESLQAAGPGHCIQRTLASAELNSGAKESSVIEEEEDEEEEEEDCDTHSFISFEETRTRHL